MRRPWLWKGSGVGALLAGGRIGAFVVTATIGSKEEGGHGISGVDRILLEAGLSLMLTAGAVVGSFSFTSDFHARSFHRRILMFQRGAALTGGAASTSVVALGSGTTTGVLFGLSGAPMANRWHVSVHVVLAFAVASGMGSLRGFAIGSLIRSHLLSLFAVPLSLVLPAAFAGFLGPFADFLFPNLVADGVNQMALGSLKLESLAGTVIWLSFALGGAYCVFSKRDLA